MPVPLNILVVDDEAILRDTLKVVLTKFGHNPTLASNGREALAALKSQRFDLVVTDLLMPDFDGLELLGQIRRTYPDIPAIAISGGGRISSNEYLLMARKLGAVAVLSKPFTPEDVATAIRAARPT